jgi:hypothetical protein
MRRLAQIGLVRERERHGRKSFIADRAIELLEFRF